VTSIDSDDQWTSVAALGEPLRRALYRFVAAQPEPVSRERAAVGVGVAHHVAKFHLDRLEADGLLEVEYGRPAGRGGPGAGRPAKLYRRSSRHISVSLPERRYDLAGSILADAVTAAQDSGVPLDRSLHEAATAAGRALGERSRSRAGPSGAADPLGVVSGALATIGYEPRVTGDCVRLSNCPFHRLADSYSSLVCGMNLDLITGMLSALPAPDAHARLDPAPGRCCVTICAKGGERPGDGR
jgi:predicted ArsR family transcriptional regulator